MLTKARSRGLRGPLLPAAAALALVVPGVAAASKVPLSAGTQLDASCSGITVDAQGSDPHHIASATFSLSQLNNDGSTTPVDGTTFLYDPPQPKQISVTWTSSSVLTPGVTYRITFQIFERDGTSPVAAGGDFTCT